MEKTEQLTLEQEKELVSFREQWLSIGLSTERTDKKTAERVLTNFYHRIGGSTPQFWHCDSPMQAQLIMNLYKGLANLEANLWDNLFANLRANLVANLFANLFANLVANLRANLFANLFANLVANLWDNLFANLWDNLEANHLEYYRTDLWGAWDVYWIAFYIFPHEKLRAMHSTEDAELLYQWGELAKSCLWIYPFKNICFVCDRPTLIKKDDQGRLHCEDGPALSFIDSYSVYTWHGTNIPKEWIEGKGNLTPKIALTHANIEQRRCACEILGWDKILTQLNAKTINKNTNPQIGELVEVDLPDSGTERFLKVQCGTGRDFAIPVPPEMKTAAQANAWSYGLDIINPEVRT